MGKILGLDIGITSIGWGIVDAETNEIVDCGVRLFEEGSADNNLKRRSYRGNRRIIRRRKQRIQDMKNLLAHHNILTNDFKLLDNPYHLRQKGLTQKLTKNELTTVLLHFAKRRGSSLEIVEDDNIKNEESTKFALGINNEKLKDLKYVVNVQLKRFDAESKIRGNKNVFKTNDYITELKAILDNQDLEQSLKNEIIYIVERRRHFSHGPGSITSPSPYGRFRNLEGDNYNKAYNFLKENYSDQDLQSRIQFSYDNKMYVYFPNGKIVNQEPLNLIELMRGKCSIYPDELRAPKNSITAELFNLLNDLNNLKFTNREHKITKEEKLKIINFIREKCSITLKQLLNILNVDEVDVTGFRIDKNNKPIITEFNGYKKILKVFKELNIPIFSDDLIDKSIEILTETIVEEERITKLSKIIDNKDLINKLSQLSGINGYHSLSFKALKQLNEEMIEEPLNHQEIITNRNLKFKDNNNKLIFNDSLILSPTAKRAHRETIKLINELIKEHKHFEKIVVETTRDKNSSEERRKINEIQKHFEQQRREAEEILGDYPKEYAKGSNILKLRLYKEQEGKCAYSGAPIDLNKLITDSRAYEIDHIIPISVSYDDSFDNKVLVLPLANQKKSNKTPFGYFNSNNVLKNYPINDFDTFEKIVLNNKNYSLNKKRNLLFKNDITKFEVLREFINRNIVDTSYAIRSIMTTLKDYFEANNIKTQVITIKGKQTSLFRKIGKNIWNMKYPNSDENPFEKNRDIYRHHAIDALIIAGLFNQKFINQLYNLVEYDDFIYDKKSGEIIDFVDPTNDCIMNKYLLKLGKLEDDKIKFSWKVDTKPNRRLADETIYSTRLVDNEHVVVKKYNDIYELEKSKLEQILSEKKREKLLIYKHDRKTFDLILSAYNQYSHEKKPLLTFKENHGPIRKYSKNNDGPIVKSIKYLEDKLGNHLDLTPLEAKNKKVVKLQLSPYRADVYYSETEKLYKFVTIRYTDLLANNSGYYIDKSWYNNQLKIKKIDKSYKFQFTLYRNNIIDIIKQDKERITTERFRFITVNNDYKSAIEFKPLNKYDPNRYIITIGSKVIKLIKYNVSVTGKASKVVNENLKLVL